MCQGLGIEIIAASSPQAKGRVERNHGTHQDRLVKKLRRKGLTRHAAVNEYLEKEYLTGAQPALCASRGREGRLPPTKAEPLRAAPDLPLGDRAADQQRLGSAPRGTLFAIATEASLRSDAGQSAGL